VTLFSSLNYREFIHEKIRQNKGTRGYRTQLAKAASCHTSYFSHMLKGEAELTPDQAAALCDFWQLNRRDAEYFITLVHLQRASSGSLQTRLQERLRELRQISDDVPDLDLVTIKMAHEQALRYFSNWYMSAVHRALSIPQLNTAEAISERLSIPLDLVEKSLEDLESMNLVLRSGKEWQSRNTALSLTINQDLMGIYHNALRSRAAFSHDRPGIGGVHFSAVAAISRKDAKTIKDAIKRMISKYAALCHHSEAEDLMGLSVDFFRI
jgi:uncharacterized protein (TIGR02147 family)